MKKQNPPTHPDKDKTVDDLYDKESNPFVHIEIVKGKKVLKSQFVEEWAKMLKKL